MDVLWEDLIAFLPVTLDRPRQLRLNRRAVKRSERYLTAALERPATFYSAMRDLARVLTEGDLAYLNITTLSILLWQGLLEDDPALTLETVENALPSLNIEALVPFVGVLFEAWNAASVPPSVPSAEEATTEPDPLDGLTGANSGRLSVSASA